MARYRTIKPQFWVSDQVVACSWGARLLFIGMWNFSDDHGRHAGSATRLKMEIFPGDSVTVDEIRRMIDELSSNGLITLYENNGLIIQVNGWHHQKIDRPQDSTFPPVTDEGSTIVRRMVDGRSTNDPRTLVERSSSARHGREVIKGTEGRELSSSAPRGDALAARGRREEVAGAALNEKNQDLEKLEAALREAAGLEDDPSPALVDLSPVLTLLDAGVSLRSQVLPVLRAKAAAGRRGRSWSYYIQAITDSRQQNEAAAKAAGEIAPSSSSANANGRAKPLTPKALESALALYDSGGIWPVGLDKDEIPEPFLERFKAVAKKHHDRW